MRNRWTRSTYRKRGKIKKISPRGAGPRDETLFFILSLTSYPPLPSRSSLSLSLSLYRSSTVPRLLPPHPRNSPTIPSFSRTRHVASQIGLYVQVSPINSTFRPLVLFDTRRILTHRSSIVAMLINDVKINQPRATTFGNARGLLTVVREH